VITWARRHVYTSTLRGVLPPRILHGDARNLDLPDESVDLVVTSPPYFGLRDYGVPGQLGAEPTPAEFIKALIECTAEMVRVLKPSGSIFVNLGDKYDKRKSLGMLPERYRIAAVDELGLIARAVIVWSKPNSLPESVTDRVRRSHEDWVHLTKAPRYFASVDELREPHAEPNGRPAYGRARPVIPGGNRGTHVGTMDHAAHRDMGQNPLGKLPGSVWDIATQPLKVPAELGVDHFAAFPMEWPRRLILGWSPREVCTVCGEGRRPVADRSEKVLHRPSGAARVGVGGFDHEDEAGRRDRIGNVRTVHRIIGYACACPDATAPSTPGVVLDPFGGTGTTALVATMLGRQGISVDLSADYCRLAEWRVNDPKQRERAARAAKGRAA
jgi:DNA modification methylase